MDLDAVMAESNARGRAGRRAARVIFAVGLAVPAVLAVFFLTLPSSMYDPMPGDPAQLLVPIVALIGMGGGLTWMWRILRANPEPDTAAWRYRDF
jgi:hypothetical protein